MRWLGQILKCIHVRHTIEHLLGRFLPRGIQQEFEEAERRNGIRGACLGGR